MDKYLHLGSEVHVDAVRDAFLSAYGPGEFTHSDANEGAAKVFDGWVRYLQSEAWDKGKEYGLKRANREIPSQPNPYREATE